MKLETKCLHAGYQPDPTTNSRAVPLYKTSSYVFNNTEHAANLFGLRELGNIYTRLMNPTTDVLEQRVAALEGGAAGLGIASGTSAVFYSIINIAEAGDEIVSANNLYGGTYTQFNDILPKLGIKVNFVDPNDPQNFAAAITPKTKALFCESVSNPGLDVADLEAISKIANDHGIPLIVDSTFSTPYLTRPIEHGASIVVHSLTKWLGGQGNGIGGIVIDSGTFDWKNGNFPLYDQPDSSYHGLRWGHDLPEPLAPLAFILRMRTVPLRNLGACISPDNSWQFIQGIETLPLRMERHCENALTVAKHLKNHASVEWARFPGLEDDPNYSLNQKYLGGKGGSMVVFGIKGGAEAGSKFIDNLKLFSHLANVGDARSLAIHPATTTHSQLTEDQQRAGGITPELIRLSVGIEHADDLLADLDQALGKVPTKEIAEEFEINIEINTQEQLEKFKNGDPTAKVNLSKWLKAKQQKAQKGDLDAQVSVGWCHYHGATIPKDLLKGVELWKKAAELGNITAMVNLAIHYAQQSGTEDPAESYKWCRKAAELGDVQCQYGLGTKLLNGIGVSYSLEEAVHWLIKAAENGSEEAIDPLSEILSEGPGDFNRKYHLDEDDDRDILSILSRFFNSLAEKGDGFARYTLDLRAKVCGVTEIKLTRAAVKFLLSKGSLVESVDLSMYTDIENDAADALINYEGIILRLNGISYLSDEASESLSKLCVNGLELRGLRELSVANARLFSKISMVYLDRLTSLSDEAADGLVRQPSQLHIPADWLEKYSNQFGQFSLEGKKIEDDEIQVLSDHFEKLYEDLSIAEKNKVPDRDTSGIGPYFAGIHDRYQARLSEISFLSLDSLTEISDSVSESLSKLGGINFLSLNGLSKLSDSSAKSLSKIAGGSIQLGGLQTISNAAAESLAKYKGDLVLPEAHKAKVDAFKKN